MKKKWIAVMIVVLMILCCGCAKESQNVATATFDYEPFDISLEQTVNRDDEMQVKVTLSLPEGTTWGDIIADPVPDDDIESVLVLTYAYNLFQSHLTDDILGEQRGYEEIQADTAFMEQYNGLEEYPHMQTTAVTFNTSTSTVIFKFDKDELDLGNPQMCLVLPYYKVKYADIEDTTDDYIHEFDGPFILNWEAVYE